MITDYADKEYNEVRSTKKPEADKTENWSISVRILRQGVIPPFSEPPVLITTCADGVVPLDQPPYLAKHCNALTAKGVMEIIANMPFYVLI